MVKNVPQGTVVFRAVGRGYVYYFCRLVSRQEGPLVAGFY